MRGRRLLGMAALVGLVAAGTGLGGGAAAAPSEPLRLNDIQVRGSHNSYHVEQPAAVLDSYYAAAPQLEPQLLAYTQPPLTDQLELGFRQFELDLFADRLGTLFEPVGTPGFKVLHIDALDEGSRCPLFTDCLAEIEAWSQANPDHAPVAILLEMKEGIIKPTGPITAADLVALDAEIRSVFDDDQLVTPDFVRGVGRPGGADGDGTVYPNVNAAILDEGWPLLEDTRGRVMFLLDNERDDYVDGDPTLAGRVAFPPSTPGLPDAAFLKMNEPEGSQTALIQARVAEGYMVRTRSDLPVETGLTGDATQREAALASGAQWVSGDYLTPTAYARYDQAFADRFDLPFDPARPAYETTLPGGTPARCNPITAPPGCTSADIEPGPPPTTPTVLPGSASVVEGDGATTTLEVPVWLSAPSNRTVDVAWNTLPVPGFDRDQATAGTDYAAASGTVTFSPGETAATVSIEITGDAAAEPTELVIVSFHDPTNARMGGFWGLGLGEIVNDEVGTGVVVLPGTSSMVEGTSAAPTLEVPVRLSEPSAETVTVDWVTLPVDGLAEPQAEPGSDSVATGGTVTFAPGETAGVATVTLAPDAVREPSELLVVSFGNPTNARMGGFWGLAVTVLVDDD